MVRQFITLSSCRPRRPLRLSVIDHVSRVPDCRTIIMCHPTVAYIRPPGKPCHSTGFVRRFDVSRTTSQNVPLELTADQHFGGKLIHSRYALLGCMLLVIIAMYLVFLTLDKTQTIVHSLNGVARILNVGWQWSPQNGRL